MASTNVRWERSSGRGILHFTRSIMARPVLPGPAGDEAFRAAASLTKSVPAVTSVGSTPPRSGPTGIVPSSFHGFSSAQTWHATGKQCAATP